MTFAVSWIPRTTYSPLIPEMTSALHLTYTQAGLLMTGFWVGYVVTQLPSGFISDRIGVKRTFVGGLVLIGIFSITTGMASSFVDCLVYRVLCGSAAGCIFAPGSALVLRWFNPKSRGIGTSLYATGARVGVLIGLIFAPAISVFFGAWRWSFWILSVPPFFMAIVVFLFMKESPETWSSKTMKKSKTMKRSLSYGVIFKKKTLWLLILAFSAFFVAYNAIMTWAASYFVRTFGVSPVYAGLIVSLYSGSGIIGMALGGIIADKVIKRRAPVMFLSYMITSAGCLAMPKMVSSGIWFTVSLLVFFGLFGSMGAGLGSAIVSDWFPLEISGTASGFLNLATLGGCVSPSVFGAILDVTGSFPMAWIVLGTISAILSMAIIPLIYARL